MRAWQARLGSVDRTVETLIRQAASDIARQRSPAAQKAIIAKLAHEARQLERHSVFMSLMSTQDVAEHFGVTPRRIQAKVKWLRERGHEAGWEIPGANTWIFHPEELQNLEPLPAGRQAKGRKMT